MPEIKLTEPVEGLRFIDVHCHLPFPRSKKTNKLPSDEQQYFDYFKMGGVYLITSSIDNITLNLILDFAKNKKNIGITCGWAPQTVTYTSKTQYENEWEKWFKFIRNNQDKYIAIGEIGLDFHHAQDLEKREKQISELRKIFKLTESFEKPYVLHVRNAAEHEYDKKNPKHRYNKKDGATKEILNIIRDFKLNPEKILWHCFSGPDEYGTMLPKQGFKLSVPSSAYSSKKWRRATQNTPLTALLTETDSYFQHPYLRGPINVPSNVRYSIAAIAHSHNVSQNLVCETTISNAKSFFNLELD
ncbi:MAG: TatD family hydrolase [Promethearchaeota archaeon]